MLQVDRSLFKGFVFLTLLAIYLIAPQPPEPWNHLLLVLTVMMAVHLYDVLVMRREFIRQIEQKMTEVLGERNLYRPAQATGLISLYESRKKAVDDVISAVKSAKDRVWICGITLHRDVALSEVLAAAHDSPVGSDLGGKLRILMLDPHRLAAIFRAILENPIGRVQEIFARTRVTDHPYLQLTNYSNFRHTLDVLRNSGAPSVCIRFYRHSPMAWMVLVDDEVFWEPYTIGHVGSMRDRPDSVRVLSGVLPVFRFGQKTGSKTFDVLEDHFEKAWGTATLDGFQMALRLQTASKSVQVVINRTHQWLFSVFQSLYGGTGRDNKDRRSCVRLPCTTHSELVWRQNGIEGRAKVQNYSANGLCLSIEGNNRPAKGLIHFDCHQEISDEAVMAVYEALITKNSGRFRVLRVSDEESPQAAFAATAVNSLPQFSV